MRFELIADEAVHTHSAEPLASFYQLSPFVWRDIDSQLHVQLRAVNFSDDASEKIARIYHGISRDGIEFYMDLDPSIAPGPDDYDRDGCEDPTVVRHRERLYVYYTAWNQGGRRGALALADGPHPGDLHKRGVVLASHAERLNPKEAEIVQSADGTWRLFFEFAHEGRSKIGMATSQHVDGSWHELEPPLHSRPRLWDSWHLSTGPVVEVGDNRVMFYNGANGDAKWRIGYAVFDESLARIIDRCSDVLIKPPRPKGDETDIAFAASALREGDLIRLYYSVADQYMRRATILPLTS
jgi:predicted GH43/DUF377 family glycosyl hydrolase